MLFRKFGKVLLGKATPFHLVLSCLIGAWLGFAVSFGQAPGYWVVLAALICVLPVNLFLAGLTGLVAYPLSMLLVPASFSVGRVLLDGPTRPLFEALINAPFTALMGFEYYAHTGGIVMGALVGGVIGWALVRAVKLLRRAYLDMDTKSEKFRAWTSKWWVGLVSWLLLGAKPSRETYEKLQARRVGLPVRPAGLVVALLVVGGFVWASYSLSGPILTRSLRKGLEQANGATVDLEKAEILLGEGSVAIDALAMADPKALDTDLLRGLKLEADVSVGDLLKRRFKIDKVVLTQAASGVKRDVPGVLTGTEPVPQDAPPGEEDVKTIDDYLKDAEKWRERLAQVRRLLDRLSGAPDPKEEGEEETFDERVERWAKEIGYAKIAAEHLVRGTPRLVIGELRIEGLQAMQVGGKAFDVLGENLSTHPHLLDAPPRLSVRARDGSIVFDVRLASAAKGGGTSEIELKWAGIPGDYVGKQLKVAGEAPVQGGTIDLESKGSWSRGELDLPLRVVLKGTTLALPGTGRSTKVDSLDLPLRAYGPLDHPRILFQEQDLKQALIAKGKGELFKALDEKLPDDVKKKAGGLLDRLKGGK